MILGVVILVLVGAIAYFHYVQGFFSAALSAILTIISAALAFSFHEVIVRTLLAGKAADQAHAMVLVSLFVVTYLVLRIIFDMAVPGNIRLPVLMDKVGAGVAGIVAGVFAMGILVIAAQTLPFGPSIGGYARYEVEDKEIQVPTRRQAIDAEAHAVLKNGDPLPGTAENRDNDPSSSSLMVDDIVVRTVAYLSNGGSLAGPQSLAQVHPNYLDELFGQRLGIQAGAKHVAYNVPKDEQIRVRDLYTLDAIAQADGEIPAITDRWSQPLSPSVASTSQDILLIVRVNFLRNASDSDNNVRVSTGAVRFVANGFNYYPIGTLDVDPVPVVRRNRPDDFLIVPADGVVDFVFQLPRQKTGIDVDPKNKDVTIQIPDGVFIEVKRLGDIDLSNKEVKREIPPSAGAAGVKRKTDLPKAKAVAGSPVAAAPAAANVPLEPIPNKDFVVVSADLPIPINVGPHDVGQAANVTFRSGTAQLREGKFVRVQIDPMDTVTAISAGDYPVNELWVPEGQKVVQLFGSPPSRSANTWEWGDKLGKFELMDSKGGSYKPRGAWAKVKQGTSDRMIARWDAEKQVNEISGSNDMRPTDVWIAFVVPQKTTIKEIRFDGKSVKSLTQQVD